MARRILQTNDAPQAVGAYSQAVIDGGFLFSAGQIAIDPAVGKLIDADVTDQAKQVMKNLRAILQAADCSFGDVVKTTIYITQMADFQAVNTVYGEHFTEAPPARSTVAVRELPLGALVEIDVVARCES